VGSALLRKLQQQGYSNLITQGINVLDLRRQSDVEAFFSREKPEYIFLAAAKVGGIKANADYPADFIYDNLMISSNIIHAAYTHKIKKLLFLGSSCSYPRMCSQPIEEDDLLTGPLENTNEPYAIAKIAGIKLCESFNRQHSTHFIACMPTNLYGPCDNFDTATAHVIPALIAKFYEAYITDKQSVILWGTGTARREFLYVDDFADAALFLMNNYEQKKIINVGFGKDITIHELAYMVKNSIGFKGTVFFDCQHPDGTPQKLLNTSRLCLMGWQASTTLKEGLQKTVAWYIEQQ
jgi:GDP-L-fucose synthase